MDKLALVERIKQIHADCYQLCQQAFGKDLLNSGNMGVFCQNDQEYQLFSKIAQSLVLQSDNPKQKYFTLIEPIIIGEIDYQYLYIRLPDPSGYGKYLGDVDFYLPDADYQELKERLLEGEIIKNAQIYDRPGWDMIQLTDPNIKSVAYVSILDMTQKVHVKI